MGCKESKQVKVQPVGAIELARHKAKLRKCASEDEAIECDYKDKSLNGGKRSKSSKSRKSRGNGDDDSSMGSDRGGSAGSKKSTDSGLDLGMDNRGFVTEYSDPKKIKEVEDHFRDRDGLDLGLTGTALATRNSAKDKSRLEESMILQKLREEGLISKTTAEKRGGVSFDIVEEKPNTAKLNSLPPLKLAKLERRRKKKKEDLTAEEIKEKLQRAEQRRKRKEEARLDKIKEMNRVDQTSALESFEQYRKKKEEHVTHKMESVIDNKERKLNQLKEKAKERERRREEVRRRKQMNLEMGITNQGVIETSGGMSLEREETPIMH